MRLIKLKRCGSGKGRARVLILCLSSILLITFSSLQIHTPCAYVFVCYTCGDKNVVSNMDNEYRIRTQCAHGEWEMLESERYKLAKTWVPRAIWLVSIGQCTN